VKVGYIKRSGILSGGYDICEWATVIWVKEHVHDWEPGDPIQLDRQGNNILLHNSKVNKYPRLNAPLKTPPAPEQPPKDLNNLNCNQLKDLLREASLKVGGRKQELIDRLEKHSLPRVEHDPMHG
jgi:hypothetical protein